MTNEEAAMYGYRNAKEYFELMGEPEFILDDQMMDSWDIWCAMATQWRMGMNGATGLDYNALPFLMDTYKISDREATLNDVRIMEAHMMALLREKARKNQ